jgi:uncharacterized protein YerC
LKLVATEITLQGIQTALASLETETTVSTLATEATVATLATEATVSTLATELTLSTLATESTLDDIKTDVGALAAELVGAKYRLPYGADSYTVTTTSPTIYTVDYRTGGVAGTIVGTRVITHDGSLVMPIASVGGTV